MAQEISDEKHLKKLINFPNSWNDSIKEYLNPNYAIEYPKIIKSYKIA